MKSYLANALFSEADRMYNDHLASRLRIAFPDLELYVPQENSAINDKSAYASSSEISRGDDEELLTSDFLIAVIDSNGDIDSGVACEIGKYAGLDIAYQLRTGEKPRPILALYTDSRQNGRGNDKKILALIGDPVENQFNYRNLYVIGTIKDSGGKVVSSIDDLIFAIERYENSLTNG